MRLNWNHLLSLSVALALLFTLAVTASGQKIALIDVEKTDFASRYIDQLTERLRKRLSVIDRDLAATAFTQAAPVNPLNMAAAESKRIGAVIGCDFYFIIKPKIYRRSSSQMPEYYEASAAIFLVSSRTGRLIQWKMPRFNAQKRQLAENLLADSIEATVSEAEDIIAAAIKTETTIQPIPQLEEIPDENSSAAKNFKAPIPYNRIKPEYTADAAFYDVKATVEVEVDLDEAGKITRSAIVRWAGYGLDDSVEAAVRKMQWRPAFREGKPLPIRFLLRYNFKKIEKT